MDRQFFVYKIGIEFLFPRDDNIVRDVFRDDVVTQEFHGETGAAFGHKKSLYILMKFSFVIPDCFMIASTVRQLTGL